MSMRRDLGVGNGRGKGMGEVYGVENRSGHEFCQSGSVIVGRTRSAGIFPVMWCESATVL